jgi:hypothetical protein
VPTLQGQGGGTLVLDRECRIENDYGREARMFWKDIAGT